jgi:hypothetical protein
MQALSASEGIPPRKPRTGCARIDAADAPASGSPGLRQGACMGAGVGISPGLRLGACMGAGVVRLGACMEA